MNHQQAVTMLKSLRGARKQDLPRRKGERANESDSFWSRFRDVESALRIVYPFVPFAMEAAKKKFRGCFRWDGLRISLLKIVDPPLLSVAEMEAALDELIDEAVGIAGQVFE